MRLTPVRDLHIKRWAGEWWICECPEGDKALPNTKGVRLPEEALASAEAWFAPEIDALEAGTDQSEQARY